MGVRHHVVYDSFGDDEYIVELSKREHFLLHFSPYSPCFFCGSSSKPNRRMYVLFDPSTLTFVVPRKYPTLGSKSKLVIIGVFCRSCSSKAFEEGYVIWTHLIRRFLLPGARYWDNGVCSFEYNPFFERYDLVKPYNTLHSLYSSDKEAFDFLYSYLRGKFVNSGVRNALRSLGLWWGD